MITTTFEIISIFALFFLFTFSNGKPPVLTGKEKEAVNKLRADMEGKLTAKHMKSDAYLIKWLKAKEFDHTKAKQALEKTLEWRKSVNADNLPHEDYGPELTKKYVIDFSTAKDNTGNPVVMIPFGDWDLRRKALQGKIVSDLGRRLDFLEEKSAQLAFNYTGDPTSLLIVDMKGFALRKHVCAGCIPFYLNWVIHHEVHYPYNYYKVLCINTPQIFDPVLNLMRPLMTASTRDAFTTRGSDREEYAKEIAETTDLDSIPFRFGGNKKQNF